MTMASNIGTRVCRLCRGLVKSVKAISLFTATGLQQQWAKRIESLLQVTACIDDGLPTHICNKCKTKIIAFEKADADLREFRELARCSKTALERVSCPVKRAKSTSGDVGVSPDTARERPKCKLSRKRLDFEIPFKSGSPSLATSATTPPLIASSPLPLGSTPATDQSTSSPLPLRSIQVAEKQTTPTLKKSVTVTVSTPSRTPYTKTLGDSEAKVARQLLGGHAPSIAKAVMAIEDVRESLYQLVLKTINDECNAICQRKNASTFRKLTMDQVVDFKWSLLIDELTSKAPLLFSVLSSIATHSDHRNITKVGAAHNPGICMAAAVILKERNREICGLQSLLSLLLYSCHSEKKVYDRLNQVNICVSYPATLSLMDEVSRLHTVPLARWIANGDVYKFFGDNVNKKRNRRDQRSDIKTDMVNMFSVLASRSRTPASELSHSGTVGKVSDFSPNEFLPTCDDVQSVKSNLVIIVSRVLTQYISALAPLCKSIEAHIKHKYSSEMSKKSDVVVLDVLMKDETKHSDMISIMETMQNYLRKDYDEKRRVLSGGDLLTCERQQGSQKHMMCGNTPRERLEILEPVAEDWHCLVTLLEVIWKTLYKSSAKCHGTLMFFRNKLNRTSVSKEVKKQVDATVDFLYTVVKGHWVACACNMLGISNVDGPVEFPRGIYKAEAHVQREFVESIAKKVVEQLTLVDSAFIVPGEMEDTEDTCYNYARVLCHYGSLVMEFRDAWAEGDGERVLRCWKLFLPHFKQAGRVKYSLASLNVQLQTMATLSPNAAHQVMWHRFVNTKGGVGRNIPCDLHNEHINKQVKYIIQNMGTNLTENALHRAARSVTTLETVCEAYDSQTGVPYGTSAHSTRPDIVDVVKVVDTVLDNKLLKPTPGRTHFTFPNLHVDPLCKWDVDKTKTWIQRKKKDYFMYRCVARDDEIHSDESSDVDDSDTD